VRAQETLRGVLPALGEPEVWVEVALLSRLAGVPQMCSSKFLTLGRFERALAAEG
jgi:hypothetical protein